jgi:hypothetical protein
MFKPYIILATIVNLPEPNFVDINILSKLDYAAQSIIVQEQHQQSIEDTINYNYIKSKDQIESLIQKYQDIIP